MQVVLLVVKLSVNDFECHPTPMPTEQIKIVEMCFLTRQPLEFYVHLGVVAA